MKTILKKNNATALILSSILLFSTATQANSTMSELENSETQIKASLFVKSLSLNTDTNKMLSNSTTKNTTRTIKSSTEPAQLEYLNTFKDWKSLIKPTASCSTVFARTGCDSSYSSNSSFKSSSSLVKLEPKQKVVVTIDFHDDSAKNAWAEYEMQLIFSNLEQKSLTGVIAVTKDSTVSYVNNLPYAVYTNAVVYNNLGSGITITATAVDKDK